MIKPRLTIMINLFLLLNLGMFIFGCSDDEEKETQEQEIQQLVKELGGGDGMIRTYATVALSRMGEPAVPALIEALNHQDVGVRWNAVVALNMMGKPAKLAVSALIKSLEKSGISLMKSSWVTSPSKSENTSSRLSSDALSSLSGSKAQSVRK